MRCREGRKTAPCVVRGSGVAARDSDGRGGGKSTSQFGDEFTQGMALNVSHALGHYYDWRPKYFWSKSLQRGQYIVRAHRTSTGNIGAQL